jgi:hypothetical protein
VSLKLAPEDPLTDGIETDSGVSRELGLRCLLRVCWAFIC